MTYDVILVGTGGVGSAAAMHCAARGASVLACDRFPLGHDRGSSHGQTRIIRQAYFEHPDYVPLLLRAYELWAELERRTGRQLFFPTGLLQTGPADGAVVRGVQAAAQLHGLEVETLARSALRRDYPQFAVPEEHVGVLEPRAGYLRVEDCVVAHGAEARRLGAELRPGETVRRWSRAGAGVRVETDRGAYEAGRLIVTAGAWARDLLADLGVPLRVLRKHLHWQRCDDPRYAAAHGCPAYLFELPHGVFYGFPQIDAQGVKVAEHSGGEVVTDPLTVDRSFDPVDGGRVAEFVRAVLPGVAPERLAHAVCLYTMSPDEHFLVDRHPTLPQVLFAAGLSGHGFKFTSLLGEVLADLALAGNTRQPIGFLGLQRLGKA